MGFNTTGANLVDAAILGARVGHGLGLVKLPTVVDHLKARNIAVEVCPWSNFALQFVGDMRDHPATSLLAQGVAITLSPDDPAILGYGDDWLTADWFGAVLNWDIDLASIKQMLINSLAHSSLSTAAKAKALQSWHTRWEYWVANVTFA
mmetsp:Transcript_26101/g.61527  ORF Transcript_26101/g.61527 Transcript_26101/m.61527 type:complete len:149 (+) Transcript_26101:114-560(+)